MILAHEHLESFRDTYRKARRIHYDDDAAAQCPMNPVIRFEHRNTPCGMRWMWSLDSGLNTDKDTRYRFELEAFNAWFGETYDNAAYVPSLEDMIQFACPFPSYWRPAE